MSYIFLFSIVLKISILEAVMCSQLDHDWRTLSWLSKVSNRIRVLVTIFLVHMLKVVVWSQISNQNLHCCFCKCFSEANSLATVEWSPRKCMSLLPIRFEIEWVVFVPSLRKELSGSLPLLTVEVKSIEINGHLSTSLDVVLANFTILLKVNWRV